MMASHPLTPLRRLDVRIWELSSRVDELADRLFTVWPVPAECAEAARDAQDSLFEAQRKLVTLQRQLRPHVQAADVGAAHGPDRHA